MTTSLNRFEISVLGIGVAVLALAMSTAGCAEVAGSGAYAAIPSVSFNCSTGACATTNGSRFVHVSYTTSGCNSAQFGETVTGSTNVTCGAGLCQGSISSFVDSSGAATSMKEGFYSICVTVDVDNNWSGEPASGDMAGNKQNLNVVSGTPTQSVTTFTAVP